MTQCEQPAPPPATPPASNAAGWVLLALVVIVVVFDIWALKTKRPTLSQWMKKKVKSKRWWRWPLIAIFGSLLWHVLLGGPI